MMDADRGGWRWTLLIVLPAAAPRLRLGTLDEGRVARVLHVGPYSAERPTIERLAEPR